MRGFASRAYIALRHARQILLAGALSACTAASAQQTVVEERPDIAYGPYPAEQADFYVPDMPKAKRPAVILIHGGGWVSGSRHAGDGLANLLASMGVVVMNIDYRLADKNIPATRWPAQLADAQLAVRYLRANAAELGVDPNRLGAMGDSAGAQLAVFLGTSPKPVPSDVSTLYGNQRTDVAAVVDQFGPMDIPAMKTYGVGSMDAMFGTVTPLPADLMSTSPLLSINARSAPVYIIHGTGDQVVPIESSQQLAATLKAYNVPVEMITYEGDHGFSGLDKDKIGKLQYDSAVWLVTRLKR